MYVYGLLVFLYSLSAIVSWQLRGSTRPIRSYYGADLPAEFAGPVYWVHAVSMGETKAVAPIVRRLKERGGTVIVSNITDTGHAEALRSIPEADHHIFLPFDIPWVMRRLMARAKPELVVLSEGDYWPAFLSAAKRQGAKIAVVNAKMSERSLRHHKRFSWLAARLFGGVDLFCVQGETYLARFRALGIAEERLALCGNLKYDIAPQTGDVAALREHLKLGDSIVLTIGSTHDPEERDLLAALQPLLVAHPKLKVLVVPRHKDRFDEVARLTDGRYTGTLTGEERTICIDTIGSLNSCYALSDAAIVAGSYTDKIGGHNLLEPIFQRVPTFYGPHMHTQPDMELLVREKEAGEQLGLAELAPRLDQLLSDASQRAKLQRAGETLLASISGSTERTWAEIEKKCFSLDP